MNPTELQDRLEHIRTRIEDMGAETLDDFDFGALFLVSVESFESMESDSDLPAFLESFGMDLRPVSPDFFGVFNWG